MQHCETRSVPNCCKDESGVNAAVRQTETAGGTRRPAGVRIPATQEQINNIIIEKKSVGKEALRSF